MAWGATARHAQSIFTNMVGKVVDIGPVGYTQFEGRDQFELARDFQALIVTDKQQEEVYGSLCITYRAICELPQSQPKTRVHVKGYVQNVKKLDGPAPNGRMWRHFTLSDPSGLVVQCTAWGALASDVEFNRGDFIELLNAQVNNYDQKILIDQQSVLVNSGPASKYIRPPEYFKPLTWSNGSRFSSGATSWN